MKFLKKLQELERVDITVQPQGQGPDGIAVLVKVEIFDLHESGNNVTKKKVSCFGSADTMKKATNTALSEAVKLLGL